MSTKISFVAMGQTNSWGDQVATLKCMTEDKKDNRHCSRSKRHESSRLTSERSHSRDRIDKCSDNKNYLSPKRCVGEFASCSFLYCCK